MASVSEMLVVFLICLNTVVSEEADLYKFLVVSTSERPNEVQSVADRLKLEFKLDKMVIDKLEMELKKHLELSHKEFRIEYNEMDKKIVDLQKSKISLEEQLKDAQKEVAELKNSIISSDTQIQNFQNQVIDNNYECKKTGNRIQEQSNWLEKNSKKIQNLEEQVMECSLPKDCKEIQKNELNYSGIYRIKPVFFIKSFKVWCDMETRDGGWIYLLNRFNGSVDFNLNWTDYKQGFGDLRGEHWLGLENLYHLTGSQTKELLIELIDWDMKKVYAHFKRFSIENEKKGYFLKTLEEYSGDAGKDFLYHLKSKFSTKDLPGNQTCARKYEAGWWYLDCYWCLLTGKYHSETSSKSHLGHKSGINSGSFHGYAYSLKEARMMIR